MVRGMKKTVMSRLAIILFSLIFISTNTEGYPASFTSNVQTKSYNPSSLYDLNCVVNSISEPSEEEAKLDFIHQNQIHSALSSYFPLPIDFFSEMIVFGSLEPVSIESLEKPKNRAPPVHSI